MVLTLKRLAIRKAPPSLLFEFSTRGVNATNNSTLNNPSSTATSSSESGNGLLSSPLHHVVVELLADAVPRSPTDDEGARKLMLQLRDLFPLYLSVAVISDEKLTSLLMALSTHTGKSNINSSSNSSPPSSSLHHHRQTLPPPPPLSSFLSSAIEGIGDLQRAKPAALQAAKARMDVVFDANRILPGMPGFVYDKRVEFNSEETAEPSDWD